MDTNRFAITGKGQVYELRDHDRPRLLGHISCLSREQTRVGCAVREWWRARLHAEETDDLIGERQ